LFLFLREASPRLIGLVVREREEEYRTEDAASAGEVEGPVDGGVNYAGGDDWGDDGAGFVSEL
jgi:hypothetical protein